jgi:hypothetical protein
MCVALYGISPDDPGSAEQDTRHAHKEHDHHVEEAQSIREKAALTMKKVQR